MTTIGTDGDTAADAALKFARTWWAQPRKIADAQHLGEDGDYFMTFRLQFGTIDYGVRPAANGIGWDIVRIAQA